MDNQTPTSQVERCGHTTIVSIKALLESVANEDNTTFFLNTLAGTLSVEINPSFIIMKRKHLSVDIMLALKIKNSWFAEY
ncbi:PhzF family phenazine biosynthesis protein [Lysinibacillus sp. MHQ-1]|nr:PhzF family phenazine biosynthesis protein [Lysinibacillus sp. MHQ-1]